MHFRLRAFRPRRECRSVAVGADDARYFRHASAALRRAYAAAQMLAPRLFIYARRARRAESARARAAARAMRRHAH